jgi:hypothetical protein
MEATTAKSTLELDFSFEKATKGAVRYRELHAIDAEPRVGLLYVRKAALASIGRWSHEKPFPMDLKVTIQGADDDE